jgi:hypothetical protein
VPALARRDQIEREAGAEFDRRRNEFVVRARSAIEKLGPTPEQVRGAHREPTGEKGRGAPLAQASMCGRAGPDFAALAREFSGTGRLQPTTNLGWSSAAQMDPAFSAGRSR